MANVGFWWSEKKTQRFNQQELELKLSAIGFNLVRIDLDQDLAVQGPFVAIIHKLSDILIAADSGDKKASQVINDFQNYVKLNPQVVVIDPLPNLRTLLNRYKQYKIIKDCPLAFKEGFFTPTFVELTGKDCEINRQKLIANGVKFPFVCKPLEAHGGSFAHQMSLIFNEKGLKDINPPCVAQTFINHNAKLFKIFVIHEKYFVVDRPSLKNFKAGDFPTLHFDSPDVSKANSSSRLTELDEGDEGGPTLIVDDKIVSKLVNILRTILGLNLFGIDLIIENETGRYLIIDMNIFPGYDGVDNHIDLIAEMVSSMVRTKKQSSPVKGDNLTESDSGIDTSDSCDENKKSVVINSHQKEMMEYMFSFGKRPDFVALQCILNFYKDADQDPLTYRDTLCSFRNFLNAKGRCKHSTQHDDRIKELLDDVETKILIHDMNNTIISSPETVASTSSS